MKKLHFLLLVVFITLLATSCENEPLIIDKNEEALQSEIKRTAMDSYPSNQMIIQYSETITEAEKENLRNQYDVVSYKRCECADPTLELWIFSANNNGRSGGGVTIEEKVVGAKEETDLEGVDFNLNINRIGRGLHTSFGTPDVNAAMSKIVASNQNVTIAVLDTGVDYNYFGFTNPFLYNNQNTCGDKMVDYYGWDFVNNDNDPFDDYGHGTIVTSLIFNKLNSQNINFQILPVKVFDQNGKGNLFDLLCGFKYAVKNTDVNIINMSFGWYGAKYELLNKFIAESEQDVLIMASAGNKGVNTDTNAHYPSVFSAENILSIAALGEKRRGNTSAIGLAGFSNFGNVTVDIAAKGENIPFYVDADNYVPVNGTSFSTAFASALGGTTYIPNISIEQHKALVINSTIQNGGLYQIKYASYIPN